MLNVKIIYTNKVFNQRNYQKLLNYNIANLRQNSLKSEIKAYKTYFSKQYWCVTSLIRLVPLISTPFCSISPICVIKLLLYPLKCTQNCIKLPQKIFTTKQRVFRTNNLPLDILVALPCYPAANSTVLHFTGLHISHMDCTTHSPPSVNWTV